MILKLKLSRITHLFFGVLLINFKTIETAVSQPIIPANDNIRTTVDSPDGRQFNILGGQRSGENLFHSFESFGLDSGQVVNFISSPDIQNILGRVNGGNPSIINGLIQVLGSQSNLFLINPAGIILGTDARLNVPADFTVTTANAIGFGNHHWFNVSGENDLSALIGTPNTFRFDIQSPGSIINLGQLEVNSGHQLTLIGGTIINTGTLSVPDGNLIIQAVQDENLVRISQPGNLLNLEIQPQPNVEIIHPLSLPELLTGMERIEATGVTVDSNGDVVLTGSELIEPGDIAIAGLNTQFNAGNIILEASHNLTLLGSQLQTTADLNLSASNTVKIRDDNGSHFAANVGGDLTLTGEENIDILTLNRPNAFQVQGYVNLISNGVISADSQFNAGGNFSLFRLNGEPGNFISLFDPIIRSNGDVIFGEYTGASLKVEARGAIIGSDITITSPDLFLAETTDPEAAILSSQPALILRSGIDLLSDSPNIDSTPEIENTVFLERELSGNNISVGSISTLGGVVIVDSPGEMIIDQINSQGGNINLRSNQTITVGQGINSEGGNIEIITDNFLRVDGTLPNTNLSISSSGSRGGGKIFIQHQGGETIPFIVGNSSLNGTEGSIFTGTETLSPTVNIPVPEDGIFTQGNITIQTTAPVRPTPPPTPPPTPEPQPEPQPEMEEEEIKIGSKNKIRNDLETEPARDENQENIVTDNIENETLSSINSIIENNVIEDPNQSETRLTLQETANGSLEIVRQISENQTILDDLRNEVITLLDSNQIEAAIPKIEQEFNFQLANYLGKKFSTFERETQVETIQAVLQQVDQQLNQKAAVVYAFSRPDKLDLILITAHGNTFYQSVAAANYQDLREKIIQFSFAVKNPIQRKDNQYLPLAQQLYEWIITPLKSELEKQQIDTILFAMDEGLRSLPIAALHDGQQFLVEQYQYSLIPSFSLINLRYTLLRQSQILAMGASEFDDLAPLPGVPIEVNTITSTLNGDAFINEYFTLNHYKNQRNQAPYRVVHLATHGDFQPGLPENSYIQFWDQKLTINNLHQLGWKWNTPPTDLFVLSACRTAIGDKNAELGFAGLAVQAGVPSALASLWYVSDQGTLALMLKFYSQLRNNSIKAEALRQTQLALLRGEIQIQSGELRGSVLRGNIELPPELARNDRSFSHPFYWAGFTLIGSPW